MSVHELNERKSSLQVLDVRSPGEWKKGHVPGAHHIFVPELGKRVGELDRKKPLAIYCGSGYRASIATSILKQQGFNELWNVPGSWEACPARSRDARQIYRPPVSNSCSCSRR